MTTKNTILQTYRDVIGMIKSNLITDLSTANGTGKINIPIEEFERLTLLTESIVDVYAANGYEILQKQVAALETKTSTRKTKK